MGALWMSAMARRHPDVRFITMSPGSNHREQKGSIPYHLLGSTLMKGMMRVMLMLGKVHNVEVGAKRYLEGLFNHSYTEAEAFTPVKKG